MDSWRSVVDDLVVSLQDDSTTAEVPQDVAQKISELYQKDKTYERFKEQSYYKRLTRFLQANCTEDELRNDDELPTKIDSWQEGLSALTKYGLNLITSPNHKVYRRIKLTTPYFVYNIKKKCHGGEELLVAMGFEKQQNSNELHYKGSECGEGVSGGVSVDLVNVGNVVVDITAMIGALRQLMKRSQSCKQSGQSYSLTYTFYSEFGDALPIIGTKSMGQSHISSSVFTGEITPSYSDRGGTTHSYSDRGGTTPSYSDRGGTNHSYSDRGGTTHSYSDRGGTTHSYSDRGGTTPSYSDRGGTTHSYSDRGGTTHSYSDRGGTNHSYSDRGGTIPSYSDRGGTVPSYSDRGGTTPSYSNRGGTTPSYSYRDVAPFLDEESSITDDPDKDFHTSSSSANTGMSKMDSLVGHVPRLYPKNPPTVRSVETPANPPQPSARPGTMQHQGHLNPHQDQHYLHPHQHQHHLSPNRYQHNTPNFQQYAHNAPQSSATVDDLTGGIGKLCISNKEDSLPPPMSGRPNATSFPQDHYRKSPHLLSISSKEDSLPPPMSGRPNATSFPQDHYRKSPHLKYRSNSMQESRSNRDDVDVVNLYPPAKPSQGQEPGIVNLFGDSDYENVPCAQKPPNQSSSPLRSLKPPVPAPRRSQGDLQQPYQPLVTSQRTPSDGSYAILSHDQSSEIQAPLYQELDNPQKPSTYTALRNQRTPLLRTHSEDVPPSGDPRSGSHRRPIQGPNFFNAGSWSKNSLSGEDDSTGGSSEQFSSGDYSRHGPSTDEESISHNRRINHY